MTRKQFSAVAVFLLGIGLALVSRNRANGWSSTPAPARGLGATATNPVEPIVKQMKAAETRLKEGKTGVETRGIQEQVVRDLDKLIEAASKQSGSPNPGSGKSQSGEKPSGEKSGQDAERGSPDSSQGAKSQQGG